MLHYADQNGYPLSECCMWKDDTVAPMPFDTRVFTRALKQIIPSHLYGIFDTFVDDWMGFAHHSVAASDQQTAQYILHRFFGSDAGAAAQPRPISGGGRLTCPRDDPPIRSRLPQTAMGLRSNPAVHQEEPGIATGISPVALIFSLPLLTSTAWKCAMCIFVQRLNALTAGTSVAQRNITSNAQFCIEVWRAVACVLAATPDALAIPLRELVPPATQHSPSSLTLGP